ncbi:LLM class oxidoreductase [Stenotrophomonas sp. SY1]|uniref:LLM class oxidoreductase n=1 Tax=Stenotrophomonas sp. SY1 TaxID=477235 RepID=UPI001E38ED31|nr:LLM class oxidoreductase [Stenotrophomonas sp. SY1]MCD9088299.1 LLM class oxidoreductase [Stenotrophomonas sp. SY1]
MSTSSVMDIGASADAFIDHAGYQRMFRADHLTLGIFLPLRFYEGDMAVLEGQGALVEYIDQQGFAAVWVRDVPLFDPMFGDAGQLFDPFTYLAYLAARTRNVALATGSVVMPLRHPIDLAKAAASIDQLSGGRLVMGIASGDRPVEFPAYGLDHAARGERFAESVSAFRRWLQPAHGTALHPWAAQGLQLLPSPASARIPLVVTGGARQSLDWVGQHADGWLTYPDATHDRAGPLRLAEKIRAWRRLVPDGGFRPHMTNEWLDLVDDPDHPRVPLQGGYQLRTGRKGLIELLEAWQRAGVNHAALGIQFSQRPAAEVLQELAEDVLPLFPSHDGPRPPHRRW